MMRSIFGIYGASGCGRGIMPIARAQLSSSSLTQDCLVFVDDSARGDQKCNGHSVVSWDSFLRLPALRRYAAIAIANSGVRERLALRLQSGGVIPWTVVSPHAMVMDEVSIGEGALISPFVTLTSNIRIGRFFHANLYSYVEHDCIIGDFVTFAPGAKCNGNVVIEDHAYIGSGAVIKQGKPGQPLVIGRGAVVGMGAVVTKNVPAGATVVGNPARVI